MRAVVLTGPGKLALMDVPRPVLREETEVLVQVKVCGICGSDLRYYAGENPWALHTLGRHIDNPPNMVLGHEFSGVVTEVNSSRYEYLRGSRVGVQAFRTCGQCRLCRTGRENLCKATVHIGHAQGWGDMPFFPGGYADYCIAWADLVYPMADRVSFEEEAMRDILGVAVHALGRAALQEGAAILCIGGGPAGLCIAQVARARGTGQVFVSDPSPLARRVVGRYGEFVCIDPSQESVTDIVASHTGTRHVAAVFDSVGSEQTIRQGLSLLEERGIYVGLAVHDVPLNVSAMDIGSERTLTVSANAHYRDEREAHELIGAGTVDVRSMITHRVPLEGYQEAFDLLLRDPKEAYKAVFDVSD